mmetsp:Transcript_70164/g.167609  ORF Transcript_70164/g.167609 Transcript_70164/m.167609 type:complete len:211 (+) Transcript_70164:1818-2450(+)
MDGSIIRSNGNSTRYGQRLSTCLLNASWIASLQTFVRGLGLWLIKTERLSSSPDSGRNSSSSKVLTQAAFNRGLPPITATFTFPGSADWSLASLWGKINSGQTSACSVCTTCWCCKSLDCANTWPYRACWKVIHRRGSQLFCLAFCSASLMIWPKRWGSPSLEASTSSATRPVASASKPGGGGPSTAMHRGCRICGFHFMNSCTPCTAVA